MYLAQTEQPQFSPWINRTLAQNEGAGRESVVPRESSVSVAVTPGNLTQNASECLGEKPNI